MSGVIVHEWLERTGGSENVFEALIELFPDAERYCLWNASDGRFGDVNESLLARTPLRGRKALALPVMPVVWRRLPAIDVDWVLCSSHAFAHQAKFRGAAAAAPKLVYAHTPARYVWVPELDGRGRGIAARAVSGALRSIDRRRAQEPIAIAANSRYVAERIAKAWEREATVIYPPVDVAYFVGEPEPLTATDQRILASLPSEYLVGVSRLVPYKRLDLAIATAAAAGLPIVISGEGPDRERLEVMASTHNVTAFFLGRTSNRLLAELYRRAVAVVFAPIEDFGIIPVEAMAAGAPVIANAVGGAAESVVDGSTGVLIHDWEDQSELRIAVTLASGLSSTATVERARAFDAEVFARAITDWVGRSLGGRP